MVRLSRVQHTWFDGPPGREQRAREVLPAVLEDWLRAGEAPLTADAGWPLGPPASSSEAWSVIFYTLQSAADDVGGYSQIVRSIADVDDEHRVALAGRAAAAVGRLAAAILCELGGVIDSDAVVQTAREFIEEVHAEDNGLSHASDALGEFLRARLVCLEERIELPDAEREKAAVGILAPLAAQAACLRWP